MTNSFPQIRLRRNRQSAWIRELLAENRLHSSDLIMPFFVIAGENQQEAINSLPGQFRFSIDLLTLQVIQARDLGIKAIMLFPAVDSSLKTANGDEAINSDNLICRAVRAIKKQVPEIGIICDVALDPYTSHGHDGLLDKNGLVLNDATLEVLTKQALVQAQAGCDIVAPSDMMDGRVDAIRKYLDDNGFEQVGIMSYAAKYASNFYGPFRSAVGSDKNLSLSQNSTNSANSKADCRPTLWGSSKSGYQMDFRNSLEAIREINLDVAEGADMLIIKPGLPYLDIVVQAKQNCNLPIISYQVSGEYTMLKLAAAAGLMDFNSSLYETLIAFKRAGATAIITYGAMEMALEINKL